MKTRHGSLILLPTLRCNAHCEYCFESHGGPRLDPARLDTLIERVLAHMVTSGMESLTIHWQGGEIMTLSPDWLLAAGERIQRAAERHGKRVLHGLQTNLIGYKRRWNPVIREMFGNRLGTSMDFPNLHRKLLNGDADAYTALWTRKLHEARDAGIGVGVIAVPNQATLTLGAARFYDYFIGELGLDDIQLNTPFPGGEDNPVKRELALDLERLVDFQRELVERWMAEGQARGVRIGPYDALLEILGHGTATLPCIWGGNCADQFIAIDPRGAVAQCDCWVSSYPDHHFGNLLATDSLGELLETSPAHRRFRRRPARILASGCLDCEYLALCHGGCPVRSHAFHGDMMAPDPYCRLYLAAFRQMRGHAARLAAARRA